MSTIWIPLTLMAAFMQAGRNALQKQLGSHINVLGVTLARFIVALPLAVIYLYLLYQLQPSQNIPMIDFAFFWRVSVAAITQIIATALMVTLFKKRNYAIGVGLAKSEALFAALLSVLFFNELLSYIAWLGVFIGVAAIWFLSLNVSKKASNSLLPSTDTLLIGFFSGLFFALCTLYIRQSSLYLSQAYQLPAVLSAAWVLLATIFIQVILLVIWLTIKQPMTFKNLYHHKKLTTAVGIFSFLGSIGWFTAMSLKSVAMVKTLGQVEILFTLCISLLWFKETLKKTDIIGLLLIIISVICIIYPTV